MSLLCWFETLRRKRERLEALDEENRRGRELAERYGMPFIGSEYIDDNRPKKQLSLDEKLAIDEKFYQCIAGHGIKDGKLRTRLKLIRDCINKT